MKKEIVEKGKKYQTAEFQKGIDHKYKLSVDYPLGVALVSWHVLMLAPLLFALWFLPDLDIWWRENLRVFCILASFGAVALVTILYWQRQIKQVWMNEEGELFYKIREREKRLKFSDYKYVRVVAYEDYLVLKVIFTDEENDRMRLLFAGTLNFVPQKSLVMSVAAMVRLEDREPVIVKNFTDEIGKSLLKEGYEIKPVQQNYPGGEGWLATRSE
ncbi:MAG: hypothetical protein ACRCZE_02040 [Candidatus Altimarinota bacterium]